MNACARSRMPNVLERGALCEKLRSISIIAYSRCGKISALAACIAKHGKSWKFTKSRCIYSRTLFAEFTANIQLLRKILIARGYVIRVVYTRGVLKLFWSASNRGGGRGEKFIIGRRPVKLHVVSAEESAMKITRGSLEECEASVCVFF